MSRAVIFDIDGTLADCKHRLHFVKHGKRDWDSFFAGMYDDTVIKPIRELLYALEDAGNKIVCCTGRPENYRGMTENWLYSSTIYPDKLYMRPAGDTRPDHIVKAQILRGIIDDGYEPFLVVDDRQTVVDMWRESGLTCLQCAPNTDTVIPDTAILSLMVGPSGAGKSHWLNSKASRAYGIHPYHVISSDKIRQDLCGDFRDQSKNDAVFEAVHALAKTRLKHGLPTVIDATHLRRKDRMTAAQLVPDTVPVRYFVIDRPEIEKRTTGGWRNEIGIDLIGKHAQTFNSQLKDILAGDGLPNVEVVCLQNEGVQS